MFPFVSVMSISRENPLVFHVSVAQPGNFSDHKISQQGKLSINKKIFAMGEKIRKLKSA